MRRDDEKNISEIDPQVLDFLKSYDFPGNVWELENIIERGVAFMSGHANRTDPSAR